jgi:hypothetical protein
MIDCTVDAGTLCASRFTCCSPPAGTPPDVAIPNRRL